MARTPPVPYRVTWLPAELTASYVAVSTRDGQEPDWAEPENLDHFATFGPQDGGTWLTITYELGVTAPERPADERIGGRPAWWDGRTLTIHGAGFRLRLRAWSAGPDPRELRKIAAGLEFPADGKWFR